MSQPHPASRGPRPSRTARAALALVPLVGIGALTACGGQASSTAEAEPVKISLGAAGGATPVRAGDQLKVTARGGILTALTVTDPKGRELSGRLAEDKKSWSASDKAAPGMKYTVVARTTNADGRPGQVKKSLTTAQAARLNKLTLSPGTKGATVGVAQPLTITFDHPVTDKAAVEERLKVTTSNDTVGSWGWVEDPSGKDRVDWRPKEYWKPGTKVFLKADLNGLDSGGDRYFAKDYDLNFSIGDSRIVKVDLDTKHLTFVRNGQEVKKIPFSAGKPDAQHSTWTGIFPLMAKEGTITTNSETVGLGNAYNKTVRDSMKLTNSGTYAHAAPWNASKVGEVNDSSGCIGMTDADAVWLYSQVSVGDPFEITGSSARGRVGPNNGITDWMVDWPQWQKKSAISARG